MTKAMLLGLLLVVSFACINDDDDAIRQEVGEVWLSGGLAVCAEQIHLDNGDTLIVSVEDVNSLSSGDRVSLNIKNVV